MSDGAVAPVGRCCENSLVDYGNLSSPWTAFKEEASKFGEGFEVGAAFSTAVMGAGLSFVAANAKGQVHGNFG